MGAVFCLNRIKKKKSTLTSKTRKAPMKYIKVIKIKENKLRVPEDIKLKRIEILNRFIDYVIRRIYLRRGQFLLCKVSFELHNWNYMMFAQFSRISGSPIIPGKVLSTTSNYQGENGIMIGDNGIFQNIEIDCWSFFQKMNFEELALYVIDQLNKKYEKHNISTIEQCGFWKCQ